MLWTNTKRILRSGFVSFWRNSFVSLASILVMSITLFMIGSLIFAGALLNSTLEQLKNKVDVNVYFITSADEGSILALKNSLEALPEVAEVTYTTRDEALAAFRLRHADDQLTLQALEELSDNPLGANLSIKAKETSQYEGIANFLEEHRTDAGTDGDIISKINFFQNKIAIERLTKIIDSAERFGFAIIIFLAVASVAITFNTIRLAIYTARDEISVMKLVGASNAYIRGPFVFEGILYGLISAAITLVLFYPITLSLGPVTEGFFSDLNLFHYYSSNFFRLLLIIVGTGVLLGALSSYLAVRRYLRQ
ncbi:hypothetical protein COU17_02680 [Candidatus Kaiserbacteria bacterium CG10_big_fil_rev_8_21_14_0_10_49_17]|uniref:Cell division protein FtsX n=1 Tax=Candidatus Kaiserbacteria bacterium CG10_big_fil_rev_8_21_14_0_10_49_17 TaxID=1974609 RepID=A0A2M6WE33_9BACT|nr:MAG: hypothetical protein COU17_02680 [Candidatus Kaiserbacteria bacterium CG10_big_fil_rev_8_21_14_0_10_49_17]